MKKLFLVIFVLASVSLFADNYWAGKKFSYEILTVTKDVEKFRGFIHFIDDKTLEIKIDKGEYTKYNYTWDQEYSIMRISQTAFSLRKNFSHWQMVKLDDESIEMFVLEEVK